MCPAEMVNSPRALVFNSDPVGHPTRSPASENHRVWQRSGGEGGRQGLSSSGSKCGGGFGGGTWGTVGVHETGKKTTL
eukprot:jgi/Undpi1/8589/HiC_scaffold_25.g11054.m1